MTQIATTIEQSKKLVELGIDVNTADMHYDEYDVNVDKLHEKGIEVFPTVNKHKNAEYKLPCWSTEALLDILDDIIVFGTEEDYHEYTLHFGKDETSYYMYYEDTEFVANNIVDELDFSCSTLLECAFEIIVKLKELKLI